MTEDKEAEAPEPEVVERSLTASLIEVAAVATPVAILAQPIVGAWADQHIGQSEKPKDPPPPEPKKD